MRDVRAKNVQCDLCDLHLHPPITRLAASSLIADVYVSVHAVADR